MENIAFIVDHFNLAPFSKRYSSLAEYDSHSGFELLELLCEVLGAIDPDLASIIKENVELKIQRITHFLEIMKYQVSDDLIQMLASANKDTINNITLWCFQNFDTFKKRSYLAKYLLPVNVPPEFMSDDLVFELLQSLQELQAQFKDTHKEADQLENIGEKIATLKEEISQMDNEKSQLQTKLQRMKKDSQVDESYFRDMVRATSALRVAQEDEAAVHQRLSEHRQALRNAEAKLKDASQQLTTFKASGAQNLSPDQLLSKMQSDVKVLYARREAITATLSERRQHLEKLGSWSDSADRTGTYEDVQSKREQIRAIQDDLKRAHARLDASDNATKLAVFRQAAAMAEKKLREREDEIDKLTTEKKHILQLVQEKESALASAIANGCNDVSSKGSAQLRASLAKNSVLYKEQHSQLAALRAELVVLQCTEQILTGKFLSTPGGSRSSLDMLVKSVETQLRTSGPRHRVRDANDNENASLDDQDIEGASIDQLSTMIDKTVRDFKLRQSQLQPVMVDLRRLRREYSDVESEYTDKKHVFEKQTVGLEMEKQSIEKQCDSAQDECLKEESRFHFLRNQLSINKIRLERAEQEQRWRDGDGRLNRDFASIKALYENKLVQQEQLVKTLRKQQRDLKELSDSVGDQKKHFLNLEQILTAKLECEQGPRANSAAESKDGLSDRTLSEHF